MSGTIKRSPETLSGNTNESIEIKSAIELQAKLGKENQIDSSISKYFESEKFVLVITQSELEELKQNYSIATLEKLLEKKSSVLEQAKKGVDDIKNALNKGTEFNSEGAKELVKSAKSAEDLINKTLGDIPGSIAKAGKEAMTQVKKEFKDITSKGFLSTMLMIGSFFGASLNDAIKIKTEGTSFTNAWKGDKLFSWLTSFFITDKLITLNKTLNPEETEKEDEDQTGGEDKNTPEEKTGKGGNVTPDITLGLEDSLEKKEKLNDAVFISTGYSILASLSGVEFNNKGNGGEKNIFNKMKDSTQEEIQNKLFSCLNHKNEPIDEKVNQLTFNGVDSSKYTGQDIFNVLSSLGNRYVNIVYKQRLNPTNLQKLLVSKEGNILPKYVHLFNEKEIILLEQGKLEFNKLKVSTIAILTTISFIGLFSYGLKKVQKMGIDSFNYITEESDIQDQLKVEIENRKEDLLPTIAYTMLPSGSKEIDTTISDFEKKVWYSGLEDIDKEKIVKFLKFKDSLLSFINTNDQISFGINDFEKNFIDGANLNNIAGLYSLLDGDYNFEQMMDKESNYDSFKKASTILWISEKIGHNSKSIQVQYLFKVGFNLYKDNNSSIFSEDDKALFKNISSDFLSMHQSWVTKKIETIDGAIFGGLTTFLVEKGIEKDMAGVIARLFEGGVAVGLGFFFKKSPVGKFIIGSGIVLPLMGYLVGEMGAKALKKQIGEDMYKDLQEMVIGEKYPLTTKNGTKASVTITSLQQLEDIQKEPEEVLERDLHGGEQFTIEGVTFIVNESKGLRVKYEKQYFDINVGPTSIDDDINKDRYKGKLINMTIAKRVGDNIIIGTGGDKTISIPIRLIIDKLKESKVINNKYIILVENHPSEESNDNFLEKSWNSLVKEHLILEKS